MFFHAKAGATSCGYAFNDYESWGLWLRWIADGGKSVNCGEEVSLARDVWMECQCD
jgi:hypothetical protein